MQNMKKILYIILFLIYSILLVIFALQISLFKTEKAELENRLKQNNEIIEEIKHYQNKLDEIESSTIKLDLDLTHYYKRMPEYPHFDEFKSRLFDLSVSSNVEIKQFEYVINSRGFFKEISMTFTIQCDERSKSDFFNSLNKSERLISGCFRSLEREHEWKVYLGTFYFIHYRMTKMDMRDFFPYPPDTKILYWPLSLWIEDIRSQVFDTRNFIHQNDEVSRKIILYKNKKKELRYLSDLVNKLDEEYRIGPNSLCEY